MKKTIITAIFALIMTGVFANVNPIKKVTIDTEKSNVVWIGKKVTGKHTGTLNFQEGYLEMDGNTITGGLFIIDMTTLQVTDLEAGSGKEKLEGHLNSPDFFGVEKHPTATFRITEVSSAGNDSYNLSGKLTIKGHSENITVVLKKDGKTAISTFSVDRTKYDIRYGSASFFDGLKNKAINDVFELTANLVLQ